MNYFNYNIDSLINALQKIRDEHGNLEVRYFDDHASFTPICGIDIVTSKYNGKELVLLHDGN